MIIPILITAYIICGAIFVALIEGSQPEFIKKWKYWLSPIFVIIWFPWLFINFWIKDRDIWFRKRYEGVD